MKRSLRFSGRLGLVLSSVCVASAAQVTSFLLLAALVLPSASTGKESADPVNRIFLVGDSAEWVATRLVVRPEDHLTLRAGSTVCFSGDDQESCVRAAGWARDSYAQEWPEDAAACDDPFPQWHHAALVARVGDEAFEVGRSTEVEGREGLLELSINDCSFEGERRNVGQFSVVIVVENPTAYAAHGGRDLIEASIDAMGGKAIRSVGSLGVRATCDGPDGAFTTEVYSLRPDQTLLRQTADETTDEWLVIGESAWRVDRAAGRRKKVSQKMRSTILSHEFQLVLFELDTRFQDHTVGVAGDEDSTDTGEESDGGCLRIEMKDPFGSPAAVCLDAETNLPVRFAHQPPGGKKQPTIEIEIEGWREIDGVQYLESFTLAQGDQLFTYRFDEIHPNSVGRGFFKQVSENSLKEIRKRLKTDRQPPAEDPEVLPEGLTEEEPPPPSEDGGEPPTGR